MTRRAVRSRSHNGATRGDGEIPRKALQGRHGYPTWPATFTNEGERR